MLPSTSLIDGTATESKESDGEERCELDRKYDVGGNSNSKPEENSNAVIVDSGYFSWKYEGNTVVSDEPNKTGGKKANELERSKGEMSNLSGSSDAVITLRDINLTIKRGELCGLVGTVGSGKSSLCQAILGEMKLLSGTISVNINRDKPTSSIAYAAQSAFIFGGTILENILFGAEYDKEWFEQVVKACSLERDFEQFENREYTIIGERGTTLSGGQKARVALARAVYQDAELYLLDDPLSAVDPKVARQLFSDVICGLLKDKTRILVTHQLQFIHLCDNVAMMQNGEIINYGHPETIPELDKYQNEEEDDEGDDDVTDGPGTDIEDDHKQNAQPSESATGTLAVTNKQLGITTVDTVDSNSSKPLVEFYFDEKEKKETSMILELENSTKPTKENEGKEKEKEKESGELNKLGAQEGIMEGSTSFSTYLNYFKLGGGYLYSGMCVVISVGAHALYMACDLYLVRWAAADPTTKADPSKVYEYLGLVAATCVTYIIACIFLMNLLLASSHGLFGKMLKAVVDSPLSFFQAQPQGRVLNRFSKDQSSTDETLPKDFISTYITGVVVLGSFVFIGIASPWLLITFPPVFYAFYWLRQVYIRASRQLKRLESISRSPVYSLLSEALDGIITIRAFAAQPRINQLFNELQSENSRAYFSFIGAARWVSVRFELINIIFSLITLAVMIATRNSLSPSLASISLSYMLLLLGNIQWVIRQSIEVEIGFVSVDRNIEYTKLPPEDPLQDSAEAAALVPANWPQTAAISLNNLNLIYPNSEKAVLKNVTLDIKSCEKIGVVGRTGAGKSSLVSCFFRLVQPYPDGCITIDGVDTSKLRLHDLRKHLCMIPQQPFMFEGSLRFNLDPWNEYSDTQIWKALEASELKQTVERLPNKLETQVVENGKNFSAGERQLISLCRAILGNSRLIVMDEATANIDLETDKLIQKAIHSYFKNSTVITIAHRLHTVIGGGYDKVLVLDKGAVVEFGEPWDLIQNPDSLLGKMIADTGDAMQKNLKNLAFEQWKSKRM